MLLASLQPADSKPLSRLINEELKIKNEEKLRLALSPVRRMKV